MFTADYADMSAKKKHAVSVTLEETKTIPGKGFVAVCCNHSAHRHGEYTGERRAWMNYHWTVFRASRETAKLRIADWASANEPGGPAGQELMFNFVQIHPYFGE